MLLWCRLIKILTGWGIFAGMYQASSQPSYFRSKKYSDRKSVRKSVWFPHDQRHCKLNWGVLVDCDLWQSFVLWSWLIENQPEKREWSVDIMSGNSPEMSAPSSTSPMASQSWKLSSWYNVLPVRVSLKDKVTNDVLILIQLLMNTLYNI